MGATEHKIRILIICLVFRLCFQFCIMQICFQDIMQAFEANRRRRRGKRSRIRDYLLGGAYHDDTTTEEDTSSDSDLEIY